MANTTNLNMVKPAGTDHALISVINSNMDIIDGAVGALPSGSTLQGEIESANTAIGNMQIYVNISNNDYQSAKFTAALTAISNGNYTTDKSYTVMMFFGGQNFVGSFTGTVSISSTAIRFLVGDETRVYQGVFVRSNNTLSSIQKFPRVQFYSVSVTFSNSDSGSVSVSSIDSNIINAKALIAKSAQSNGFIPMFAGVNYAGTDVIFKALASINNTVSVILTAIYE